MELLPNGSTGGHGRLLPQPENVVQLENTRDVYSMAPPPEEFAAPSVDIFGLIRRYWPLAVILLVLGLAGGFTATVITPPRYKSRLMIEVLSNTGVLPRSGDSGSFESTEVNIQTQINILRSGSFEKRGAERMQADSVPLAPPGRDIFSRLRQRVRPATRDPLENATRALGIAMATFDARPINRTRLIELTCESTNPETAAQFLNSMAAEFAEDTSRSRMQNSQKTSEWLAAQIEDAKTRLQESEEHLREFMQASGNIFVGKESTLDDTKLMQLKGELAKIQADRIAKQTRYELTLHNAPESLGEILDDGSLRGIQSQIGGLKKDRAALLIKFTEKHEKVRQLDAELAVLERNYAAEVQSVVSSIKNDFEAAQRQERLLSAEFTRQSQRVGSEAGKEAQYTALQREVEMNRQTFQSLMMQGNEVGMTSSVPINPIRIVESASAPETPYKPVPEINVSLGGLLGLVLAVGLVVIRERLDQSIKSPGVSRRMFNTPELGVIPNLNATGNGMATWRSYVRSRALSLDRPSEDPAAVMVAWQNGPSYITESFRSTLASILRNQSTGKAQKTVLITSPGPGEGKTTVIQNLGIALAESGRRVLLVDGDFRRPHLHRKFGLPNELGIVDLLADERPLSEFPNERFGVSTGFPGLSLLPNGAAQINVSRALYSPRLREIFTNLIRRYDMVLVDAPPILHVADTRIIAPLTDALILVLRCGVTDRASAMEAYQRIQEDGLTLLGTVLTDYSLDGDRAKQYYYDYGDAK